MLPSVVRFGLPWNDPGNLATCDFSIPYYHAPDQTTDDRVTNIVMPVGRDTVGERSVSLSEITDGHGETILIMALKPSSIAWYEPRDLTWEELTRAPDGHSALVQGHAFRGAYCAFVDGSVAWLPPDLEFDTLCAMLTINGGEAVDMSKVTAIR